MIAPIYSRLILAVMTHKHVKPLRLLPWNPLSPYPLLINVEISYRTPANSTKPQKVVMEIPIIPMSTEEYELSEHPLGWKMEYWNGEAHLTPREMGVKTRLDLTTFALSKPQNPHQHTLVPVDDSYAEQMVDGYFACFVNSVEFCNWPIKDIQEAAQRDITNYLSGKRGIPSSASVIALEASTQQLSGLALFKTKEEQICLSLLYVRSPFRRQGLATTMLQHGIHHLIKENCQQLTTRYHICNHQSRQFYHKLGFQDSLDPFYIRLKIGYLRQEIYRREKLKMLDELEQLRQEKEQLIEKLEQLNSEGIFY